MSAEVLIASELRELVGQEPLPGCSIEWIDAGSATPGGSYLAMVPLLSRTVGCRELDRLPRLKVVANCAVGVDNIDLDAARSRGIAVTNTPDVLTESTADLTWALILAVTRRVKEGIDLVREGRWEGWHPTQLLGLELRGRTLGLAGAGRIGQAVGKRASAFGMRVIYHDRRPRPRFEALTGAGQVDLERLFREGDVISLHLPLSAETRDLVDERLLGLVKRDAVLVNTARGELIVDQALIRALEDGRLAGAGLDVFRDEPRVPETLRLHPRVVALPHIGSATWDTRRAMAALAVGNVKAVLQGEPPLTPVIVDASKGGV